MCVSSGTAEMRAIWFLLTALGVLEAKLLKVGSPANPLFGEIHVKEVQIGDGIAQGKVRVSELHGTGSVPELQVTNVADLPALLVDGEELIGAKQKIAS